MNCIIVDDEPLAREVLEQFVNKVPFLNLKALCSNAFQAMAVLNNDSIDLIFLDIQMPDLSGMQMYQSLSTKPQVIFTTAYSDYAIEGFNARSLFKFENLKAQITAKEKNLSMTAGSDAHFKFEIGRAYTEFEGNLRKAIKDKKTKIFGNNRVAFFAGFRTTFQKYFLSLFSKN